MKIFKLLLIGIMLTFPFACKKSSGDCSLIAAKVIRYDCDRVIFQLLTSQAIGDSQWTDSFTGTSYSNVVSYYNTCEIATLTNGAMTTIYVKPEVTEDFLTNPDCVQCQAISQNPPQTKVIFTEIQAEECGND